MLERIVANFKAGLRDDVPMPKGHEVDALSSVGHVVGLAIEGDELIGYHDVRDEAMAADIRAGKVTGSSVFLNLDYVDASTGKSHGPTIIHNALTNAPYIKGLTPFEAVALGEEDAEGAVVIALEANEGGDMTLDELIAQVTEISDEDLKAGLLKARPVLFDAAVDEGEKVDLEAVKAEAKLEGTKELVAALSEAAGITVAMSEDGEKVDTVDVSTNPAFVALSETVAELKAGVARSAVEATVDAAIAEGKILPVQRDGMITVGLSEGGVKLLESLIPAQAVVDLSETGTTGGAEQRHGPDSADDVAAEVARYTSLLPGRDKKEG